MAHLEVFEGTWEELAVHAEGFAACQDCANTRYWVYQRRDARRKEMDW